ncbi:MAG: hypothetical protein QOH21_3620 [Acidobacteriota bacterium]|jgi:hypothetical protein|nr:hypothetical protein [Acidobacteriota bacterium]
MKRLWWIVAALAAFGASFFLFFFFRDNFATHYPLKVLSAQAFRAFEIPWWNFHDGGGQPLAGNPNALTFYPDNVLYLLLPAHAAFNLHFLLHLAIAWAAMRALTKSAFAATVYLLSGVVISSTAFYNLVVYAAMIPLALCAVERRSARLLGLAFGLMLLAAEPVMLLGAVGSVAIVGFRRMPFRAYVIALAVAVVIASPQLVAYLDIATEVERSAGISARTVLNTSLTPTRIAEIFVWPFTGFLNDAGGLREKLFSTLFLGVIALPALWRRSRYTAVAAVMLFLALGRYNPLVAAVVEHVDTLRIMRFPEKFALPLVVALCVLIAQFYARTRQKAIWAAITLLPLVYTTVCALPVDRFAPYDVARGTPRRTYVASTIAAGALPARAEYRLRAQHLEPLFGAVAGVRYALNRSPDRMHSLLSRIAEERFRSGQRRYLDVALALPAVFLPRTAGARNVNEAVALFERGADVAPMPFASAPARIVRYTEHGQRIELEVETRGQALLLVNQSYFSAWVARLDGTELRTMPVNVDRLGVLIPHSGTLVLTFGRHRAAVAAAWIASILLLALLLLPKRIEILDGRPGEVQRAADEDRSLA